MHFGTRAARNMSNSESLAILILQTSGDGNVPLELPILISYIQLLSRKESYRVLEFLSG